MISAAAAVLQRRADDVARDAIAPMLAESSIKKALDLEWSDPAQKAGGRPTSSDWDSWSRLEGRKPSVTGTAVFRKGTPDAAVESVRLEPRKPAAKKAAKKAAEPAEKKAAKKAGKPARRS